MPPIKNQPPANPFDTTLITWINLQLEGHDVPNVTTLSDLSDGVALCCLCKNLSDKNFRFRKEPKNGFQSGDNVAQARNIMESLFGHFHWDERELLSGDVISLREIIFTMMKQKYIIPISFGSAKMKVNLSDRQTKDVLLQWVKTQTEGLVDSTNDENWKNGMTLSGLIWSHVPHLVKFNSLDKDNKEENIENALTVAALCGAPRLIPVETFLEGVDRMSLLAYLSCLYACYKTDECEKNLKAAGKWECSQESATSSQDQQLISFLKYSLPELRFVQSKLAALEMDYAESTETSNNKIAQQNAEMEELEKAILDQENIIQKEIEDLEAEILRLTEEKLKLDAEFMKQCFYESLQAYCLSFLSKQKYASLAKQPSVPLEVPKRKLDRQASEKIIVAIGKRFVEKRKNRHVEYSLSVVNDALRKILDELFASQKKMIVAMSRFTTALESTDKKSGKNVDPYINMALIVFSLSEEMKNFQDAIDAYRTDFDSSQDKAKFDFHSHIARLGDRYKQFAESCYVESLFTEELNVKAEDAANDYVLSTTRKINNGYTVKYSKPSELFRVIIDSFIETRTHMRAFINWMPLGKDQDKYEKSMALLQEIISRTMQSVREKLGQRRLDQACLLMGYTGKKEVSKFIQEVDRSIDLEFDDMSVSCISEQRIGEVDDSETVHWRQPLMFSKALIIVKRRQFLLQTKRSSFRPSSKVFLTSDLQFLDYNKVLKDTKSMTTLFLLTLQNQGEEKNVFAFKTAKERLMVINDVKQGIRNEKIKHYKAEYKPRPFNPNSTPRRIIHHGKLLCFIKCESRPELSVWCNYYVRMHEDETIFFKKSAKGVFREEYSIQNRLVLRAQNANKSRKWIVDSLSKIPCPFPGVWLDFDNEEFAKPIHGIYTESPDVSFINQYKHVVGVEFFQKKQIRTIVDLMLQGSRYQLPEKGVENGLIADYPRVDDQGVPVFITKSIKFLKKHGLKEKGIMRIPGNKRRVNQLFELALASDNWEIDEEEYKINDVATALKTYIRELPSPLLGQDNFNRYNYLIDLEPKQRLRAIQLLILSIPKFGHINTLKVLFEFLDCVIAEKESNNMGEHQIAVCLGLSVLPDVHQSDGAPTPEEVEVSSRVNAIFENMVEWRHEIFKTPPDVNRYILSLVAASTEPVSFRPSVSSVEHCIKLEVSSAKDPVVQRYNSKKIEVLMTAPTDRSYKDWSKYTHETIASLQA